MSASWANLYARALAGYAAKFNARLPADSVQVATSAPASPPTSRFFVSEAVPAALAQAEGWYRHQIVLRAPAAKDLVAAVKWIRDARPVPEGLRLSFDVDALNLL